MARPGTVGGLSGTMTCMQGRRAIVTGGASGIGKASAIAFAAQGAHVLVTDVDRDGGGAVAEQIGGTFAHLDVADPEAWAAVVAAHGPFDLAFLNAGISTSGIAPAEQQPILGLTDDAYRRIMGINVDGVVFGIRAVMPGMADIGQGDIVVTASMAGIHPIALDPIYGLTKHAVVGLVRSVAAGVQQLPNAPDVCVSAICPGFTDTNIVGPELRTLIETRGLPLMPPEHVADVVVRSVRERVQGAQWVIWPGEEPSVYTWNPGVG